VDLIKSIWGDNILIPYLIIQALLLLYFVKWVLWRNTRLTELLIWHHKNAERFAVLDRFKTSPRTTVIEDDSIEPAGERYSYDDVIVKPIEWALEE
jgi:hypothetical protein